MSDFQFTQRRFDRIANECQEVSQSVMSRDDADCRNDVNKLSALVCELAGMVKDLHKSHRQTQFMVQD